MTTKEDLHKYAELFEKKNNHLTQYYGSKKSHILHFIKQIYK